jgi:hypothetical protein
MVVVVIGHETTATARWTSLFILRAFVNDTITVAVWTGLHLSLHGPPKKPSSVEVGQLGSNITQRSLIALW